MKLRTEVFTALAAIVRADGVVTPEEREGLLAAAKAAGANEAEVARAIDDPGSPVTEWTTTHTLTHDERVFVYAAGVWLAGVDGLVTDEETESVRKLGDALKLDDKERAVAALTASAFSADAEHGVLGLARAITQHIDTA